MSAIQSTLTNIQNDTAMIHAQQASSQTGTSTIDQNSFLQLLTQQLQNQDPTNPMDNTQMISEEAQIQSVSEMQQLNTNLTGSNQIMQASSLIGKSVSLPDPDNSTNTISGVVSEALINSSGASVVINNKEYPVSSITSISNPVTNNQ